MKHTTPTSTRPFGTGRLGIGVTAFAAGLTLLFTPLGASGQTTDGDASVSAAAVDSITITQTPSGNNSPCVPAANAISSGTLTAWPVSDAATFTVTINASVPLCEPINATAVVYGMPGGGVAWPQTLKETEAFTLQAAGQTVITFSKACDPVQFDITTGNNPQVINTGFDHTLLFPTQLDTAFQHVGNGPGCGQASTTTTSTTTSTSIAPTSVVAPTTVPVRVEPAVTTPSSTTTAKPAVLAATSIPTTSNSGLAVTGTTSGPFALVGGGLVFIGIAFILASRRRTA